MDDITHILPLLRFTYRLYNLEYIHLSVIIYIYLYVIILTYY